MCVCVHKQIQNEKKHFKESKFPISIFSNTVLKTVFSIFFLFSSLEEELLLKDKIFIGLVEEE